ncbi:TonB-dependent receptor domain-containing protein [Limnohabitans sp.]|uniref:TonB-dependent receptor plug domain-containing protein n=1 Tax=Limnohabitans sp. TaxID=1907725 RepID=UPI00286EBF5E|nr:TonB-dependent receptor [Limnohabitans sp.]
MASLAQQTTAPAAQTSDMGQIEVTSGRDNDTQQRRESTASKIVIGREEIERQGDANLGEILKRMPGITLGGAPGRGGGIRMRGLSQGYTQILLDGARVPPGFSVESLTPEMIERVEIYRAPTAETGAQAIAGTINIITREGRRGMPTELKVGSSFQGGYASPTASVVKYHDAEAWTVNYTLSVNRYAAPDQSENEFSQQLNDVTTQRYRASDSHYAREGMNVTSRMQLKGDAGETLTLMPFVALSQGKSLGLITTDQTLPSASSAVASIENKNTFAIARLNGQWKRKLSTDSNIEWKFGVGGWNSHNAYQQTASNLNAYLPSITDNSHVQDRSATMGGKYTNVLGGGHQWISGAEIESVQRIQAVGGSYQGRGGDADYKASTMRYAIYSQDEWQLTPHWATHLGARYEELTVAGNNADGNVTNRSSVFTPLLHALWRPDPDSRDQVRMSLTRSFKTPTMPTLLARRAYTRDAASTATNPDVSGNPNLKPEVATGLDIAVERYLPQGGVLSASAFHRHVQNLIRNVTSYQGSTQRWLSSPENFSEAIAQGVELEAKFRMDQWIDNAPHVDLRSNVSFYRSRVLSIDGSNNRLDQQPDMSANLGADYRLRALPLTLGGNLNYNPGYSTRASNEQLLTVSQKRVMDLYGLWRVDGNTAWRLTLSNLDPRNYNTGSTYTSTGLFEASNTQNRGWTNVQILLEKKL